MMDFDEMRDYIKSAPASPKIREMRLHMFDLWRYREDYEQIYIMYENIKRSGV